MRIVSLVPSATEILFALGLEDEVIAVTHECDYPEAATYLPRVTCDVLPPGLSTPEIDAAVRERTQRGEAIYELDEDALHDLQPELIVTQALCAVCAVSFDDVREIAQRIDCKPEVISLDPGTVGEVLGDIRTLGEMTGRAEEALLLVEEAGQRIDRVREAVADVDRRPRVAALEWLEPVFAAGHWTPQLIEYAGGDDALGMVGERSAQHTWEEVVAARPDVVVVMPCGYDAERAYEEAAEYEEELAGLFPEKIVAVDAAAYFSRPGPRLVDGLELLGHLLHPDLVPEPAARVLPVELDDDLKRTAAAAAEGLDT